MPRPSPAIVGVRFGRLVGLARLPERKVSVKCDCGVVKTVHMSHLVSGRTRSCGCLHREITSAAMSTRQTTHGYYGTQVYAVWNAMLRRCQHPQHAAYKDYGGRGITVCRRWQKFENFLADMGVPSPGLTLDRKDNSKGYSLKNCHWATRKTQASNRRSCRLLAHEGKTLNVTQWATELNFPRQKIYQWLRQGVPERDIFSRIIKGVQ